MYRDFITVGLLASKLAVKERRSPLKDNWIYIRSPMWWSPSADLQ